MKTAVPWTDENFLRGLRVVPDIQPVFPEPVQPYDPRKDFEEKVIAERLEQRRKCIAVGRIMLGGLLFTVCAGIAIWVFAAL